jgi:hypothetical protein
MDEVRSEWQRYSCSQIVLSLMLDPIFCMRFIVLLMLLDDGSVGHIRALSSKLRSSRCLRQLQSTISTLGETRILSRGFPPLFPQTCRGLGRVACVAKSGGGAVRSRRGHIVPVAMIRLSGRRCA